jgi:tRNA (guanine26-N2/guanine27-N2)-dimethyltransferase
MGKRTRTSTQDPLPSKPLPSHSSDVTVDGKEFVAIKEGLATVLFPKTSVKVDKHGKEIEERGEVFYNPIQQFNRDLSVLAIRAFSEIYLSEKKAKLHRKKSIRKEQSELVDNPVGKEPTAATSTAKEELDATTNAHARPKFTILDALSATGLRALRYTLELPMVTSATANDMDPSAVDSIRRNIEYNKQHSSSSNPEELSGAEAVSRIQPSLGNAQHHMYSVLSPPSSAQGDRPRSAKYEVIDLDPYGTAVPFLDAAVQAVTDGGLLCVTCTDAGVWASTGYSEKCYSLYGGLPVKAEWSHEAGLRLILHSIATSAAKYGMYIEPLLSLSIDFYARVWVRIKHGPAQVKKLASSTMIVYNCDEGCGSWELQRLGKAKENTAKSGSGTFVKFGLARAPTVGENCPHCESTMHVC